MEKFQKLMAIFLLLPFLLCSAVSAEEEYNGPSIIDKIQISCRRDNSVLTRIYTQPHKITAVLNYLRLIKCKNNVAVDPEQLSGDRFTIILYQAGGEKSVYRQTNLYFSKNSKPWQKIDSSRACLLYPLLQSMPSDETPGMS